MKQFFIIFLFFPVFAWSFTGKGSGTESDPYQITNIEQMQEIKNSKSAYYILMNDIDATETKNWNIGDHDQNQATPDVPMGFEPIGFAGDLNGNGFIIKNLYINRPGYTHVALFSIYSGGKFRGLKSLGLENLDITGMDYVGGICGNLTNGFIKECFTTGKIRSSGFNYLCESGGFCGDNNISLSYEGIFNCYSMCTVISDSGFEVASFSTGYGFYNCYTTGKVISPSKVGIFGNIANGSECFWDIDSTGIPDTFLQRARGLSNTEMKRKLNFSERGWDFDKIWYINEGKDYPRLRAFKRDTEGTVDEPFYLNNLSLNVSPNPFSSITEIKYSILISCKVTIRIYNSLSILVNEILNSQSNQEGNYNLFYDASDLTSGIYFLVFQSGKVTVTERLVVIK